jgi:5-methylcytosine-specific restriction endonuclease McrA
MASANSSSVSVNDHDSLSFTEKPTEDLDTAGESPQASESSSTVASRKRFRTPTATDIWTESRQPSSKEPERNRHGQKIWYCKRCAYSQTAHNRVRGHLRDKHYIQISEQPTAKKLGQNNAIDRLFRLQAARQEGHDIEQEKHLLATVDEGLYNQALVNLITAHNLPHSLVEWPE